MGIGYSGNKGPFLVEIKLHGIPVWASSIGELYMASQSEEVFGLGVVHVMIHASHGGGEARPVCLGASDWFIPGTPFRECDQLFRQCCNLFREVDDFMEVYGDDEYLRSFVLFMAQDNWKQRIQSRVPVFQNSLWEFYPTLQEFVLGERKRHGKKMWQRSSGIIEDLADYIDWRGAAGMARQKMEEEGFTVLMDTRLSSLATACVLRVR